LEPRTRLLAASPFLASDDASFVTGITMPVDGGLQLLSSLNRGRLSLLGHKSAT
ncbi:hypothetical protein MTO96_045856, partial [Rhipicephalus appendiculatus]